MLSIRGLLLLASAAFTAYTRPITWTLNGVTSLGTSITGSFVFDADTLTYSNIQISSSGGNVIRNSSSWFLSAGLRIPQPALHAPAGSTASYRTSRNGRRPRAFVLP
jgi:hypothetical protein